MVLESLKEWVGTGLSPGLMWHGWWAACAVLAARGLLAGGSRPGIAAPLWALSMALGAGGWQWALLAACGPAPQAEQPSALLAALLLPFAAAATSLWWSDTTCRQGGPRLHAAGAVLLHGIGGLLQPLLLLLASRPLPDAGWAPAPLIGAWACSLAAGLLYSQAPRLLAARSAPGRALAAALGGAVLAVLWALPAWLVLAAAPAAPAAWPAGTGVPHETLRLLAHTALPLLLGLLLLAAWLAHRFESLVAHTQDHLQQAAGTHALTGLPGRHRFEQRLLAAAMQADRHGQRIAVMCVNVDGLKTINESFGPAAGDALLCGMAQRLQRLAGPHDMVAHASGDEFLVLLAGNPDRHTAARAASHAIGRLSDALLLDAREIATSCSIGVTLYPEDGDMRTLITRAGAAVRCAKRNGRASYCFYEPHMTEGTREQVDLLHDLRRAVERQQLELVYQPKVQAAGGRMTGAEALLRWRHPTRGLVSPVVFVPLAERSGVIATLGDWVIEEACRQLAAWQAAGQSIKVSINLSVHQLRQPDLVQRLRAAMVRHGVPPGRLSCEITESAAMDDTGTTMALVKELAAAGVPLAIDDFGTGYSSLGYLRKLPVSELKIDRSFVLDLATSADACAIVDAVIRLAHALGLTVVAEGVETEAQCRMLQRLGCDELQGFLFARPMAARVLAAWAAEPLARGPVRAERSTVPAPDARMAGTGVACR